MLGLAAVGEAVSSTAPAPSSAGGLVRGSMAPSCAQLVRVPMATIGAILPVLRRAVATAVGVGACGVVVVSAGNGCAGFGAVHGVGSSPCPAGAPMSPHSAHGRAGPILRLLPAPRPRAPRSAGPAPFPLTPHQQCQPVKAHPPGPSSLREVLVWSQG